MQRGESRSGRSRCLPHERQNPDRYEFVARLGTGARAARMGGRPLVIGRRSSRNGPDHMDWALANSYVVFTHDLDFGTMLASTRAKGPSVVQLRDEDVLPDRLQQIVIAALNQHDADLAAGALVVVDASKCRVRILPI
jgi:predicted nuclease of predicted toxin-antitoxin system